MFFKTIKDTPKEDRIPLPAEITADRWVRNENGHYFSLYPMTAEEIVSSLGNTLGGFRKIVNETPIFSLGDRENPNEIVRQIARLMTIMQFANDDRPGMRDPNRYLDMGGYWKVCDLDYSTYYDPPRAFYVWELAYDRAKCTFLRMCSLPSNLDGLPIVEVIHG